MEARKRPTQGRAHYHSDVDVIQVAEASQVQRYAFEE